MNATEAMARWVVSPAPPWSPACLDGARRAFTDTVAVMLAGASEPAPHLVHAAVAGWGEGGRAMTVAGARLPAPWAALVNGTAAHAQDYDDVLDPSMSHPSAALVPALLALADEIGASGRQCLDAYLVGFEIMARLGEAMNLAHYHRGWHTTLSLGSTGVAAACARLLNLDAQATRMALSLSTSMAGGSKVHFGSMAKPWQAGLAAKNGIVAARLAASGLTGAAEAFEGAWGYAEMTSGATQGFAVPLAKLGTIPAMEEYGVWLKLYPCCASTHRPIDALRSLQRAHRFQAGDVAGIAAYVSKTSAANLRYHDPRTPAEARFSLQYCLSAALNDDLLTEASFSSAAVLRNDVRGRLPQISMAVDPALDGTMAVSDSREGARVVVQFNDGSEVEQSVANPHGHPTDPLSEAELRAKFLSCAEGVVSPAQAMTALGMLAELASLDRIDRLTAPLQPA
jgi:2-methylcitrate dehydratase PrpD